MEKAFGLTILAMIQEPSVLFNTMKEETDSDFQSFEMIFWIFEDFCEHVMAVLEMLREFG